MSESPIESPALASAALAEKLAESGDREAADRVRELSRCMTEWETRFRDRVGEMLSVHHDVNNALTGLMGNAQLLLMGPAAEVPEVKRRVETLLQEAERIREIAVRLRDLKQELQSERERIELPSPESGEEKD